MTINRAKQLLTLILEECNFEELVIPIGKSEKGEICLAFNGEFYYLVDGKKLAKKPNIKVIKSVVEGWLKKENVV